MLFKDDFFINCSDGEFVLMVFLVNKQNKDKVDTVSSRIILRQTEMGRNLIGQIIE